MFNATICSVNAGMVQKQAGEMAETDAQREHRSWRSRLQTRVRR